MHKSSSLYQHGWYQVGFTDVKEDITPLNFSDRRWMLVRQNDNFRVFDATCPHRGAHLGFGGKLAGESAVVCPFHGYKISLGDDCKHDFCVKEYETFVHAGMVFVRVSDQGITNFPAALQKLSETYSFVSGFTMELEVDAQLAIENAFDNSHFQPVHGLCREPEFEICDPDDNEFAVRGVFHIPPSDWQGQADPSKPVEVGFLARAFSPGLVVSELLGEFPYDYAVISAAAPSPKPNHCTIRLSVGLRTQPGQTPDPHLAKSLLEFSRTGLEMDRVVWNNMLPNMEPNWTEKDRCVRAFTEFCDPFHA